MEKIDFLGRGWKYLPEKPIYIKDGKISSSEGEDSIKESIMIILGTAKGERVMRPDFGCGINVIVFEPNSTSTATRIDFHVREALLKWEPRIEVTNVSVTPDSDEKNKLFIDIEYTVKKTNTKENLVYPFYLERGGI